MLTPSQPSTPPDNLVPDLTFIVGQILLSGTIEQCYLPDGVNLIRAAAAAKPSEVRAAEDKLEKKFGKDWRVMRFRADIKEAKAELTVPTESTLLVSESGAVKPILANAITKLSQDGLSVGLDIFADKVTHLAPSPWDTAAVWRDYDEVAAANHLQRGGVSISSATAHEAAYYLANQNPYHPVRDYLKSLKWDGISRLQCLFPHYFGCPDGVWVREVSRMWMISAVARVMRPGCIAKYMIVLEGLQDKGKSTGLRALVNGHLKGDSGVQWFRDNMPPIDHKDIGIYMQGVWVIEVAELSSIKRSDWEGIKSFISSPRDSFRRAYGRNLQDYPRQCVFAGTTNEEKWGGDQTGLTRFWPLRSGKILIDLKEGPCILRDRDQLWAEAYTLYNEGSAWWGDEEFDKLARREQDERTPEDDWHDQVVAIARDQTLSEEWVSTEAIKKAMGISATQQKGNYMSARIGSILRTAKWERTQRRVNGVLTWGHQRPAE